MNTAVGYIDEERRKQLLNAGYAYIAIHKDTHNILHYREKAVNGDRLGSFGIKMEGDRDYVVLRLGDK